MKNILKDKFQMKDVIIERAHWVGPFRETNEPQGQNNYQDKEQILKQKRGQNW